ncbi:MAG TPA: glutathione transferase GstA [Gammaproteobacteria bacterium]|nr:glutathione transferase GstA [Gammaproteobacteria bacterium]
MKLYYAPGACSLAPHIVANEAGIRVDLEKVDLKTKKTESGKDFLAINPKGYVPALELDDGQVLTEGPAVDQYLADREPSSGLAPPNGTLERYRLQEWLGFINSEIHKTFGMLFGSALPDAVRQERIETLKKRFAVADRLLAGKSYVLGDRFTAADAYLFVMLRWADHMKIDLSGMSQLKAIQGRIAARPAVQNALKEEGLA